MPEEVGTCFRCSQCLNGNTHHQLEIRVVSPTVVEVWCQHHKTKIVSMALQGMVKPDSNLGEWVTVSCAIVPRPG